MTSSASASTRTDLSSKPQNFTRIDPSTPVSLVVLIIGVTIAVLVITLALTAFFVYNRRKRRPSPVTPSEIPLAIIPSPPASEPSRAFPNLVDMPSTGPCPPRLCPPQPVSGSTRVPTPVDLAVPHASADRNGRGILLPTAIVSPPPVPHMAPPSYRSGSFEVPPSIASTLVGAQSNRDSYTGTSIRTVIGSIREPDRRREKLARALGRRPAGRRRRLESLSEFPIPNSHLDISIPTTDASHSAVGQGRSDSFDS
ncbi:hypothetical protein CONPUDRAFT_156168 [Coniophora puteana RWD-64-598 SS2]|uniref:Uncharacterized protein n=1 Tax=Coniophora puteana (strain RWD-64-598) TaxID=741705 RepID=A0A5M3MG71_CONPW|nr:uncharacterized protein CONPUDRAFT_156168 [Coniophora puteana RWD-64-598 SS2]EIW78163.1 hypothetical protein CONPUDRAFT_156168 [Coniophora puteana RWD-64-598 SS2]